MTPDQAKLPTENCSTLLPSISNPPTNFSLSLSCLSLFIFIYLLLPMMILFHCKPLVYFTSVFS